MVSPLKDLKQNHLDKYADRSFSEQFDEKDVGRGWKEARRQLGMAKRKNK